ncbi:MAG: hypothetical protein HY741_09840 [Chloroflexi bacterium]|nr:hypothetical protein [Chloroflexota bacterium]
MTLESESEIWVEHLGWSFNPFEHFEASTDPHLGDYLVGHQAFPAAWGRAPAFVFAPHGGGKTAARLFTARRAWIDLRAFPLVYLPAVHSEFRPPITLEQHLDGIIHGAAIALFIALTFRPTIYLNANDSQRESIYSGFADLLPAPLAYYLDLLREGETPTALPAQLGTTYLLPEVASRAQILELCNALEKSVAVSALDVSLPAQERFEQQVAIILSTTRLPALDLLVDGIDGAPETFANSERQADWLAPLVAQAPQWLDRQVYLKAFAPTDVRATLERRLTNQLTGFDQTELIWTAESLAELLRRRIYSASSGQVNSLDAYANPSLSNIEGLITQSIVPLPREALLLTSRVLDNYAERVGNSPGSIELQDVERAIAWYEQDREWVGAARALPNPNELSQIQR